MRIIFKGAAIFAVASAGLTLRHDLAWAQARDPWSGTYFGVTAGSGYGAYLGNNQKIGNFIIGGEAEAKSGSHAYDGLVIDKPGAVDVNWALSARARAGVLVMPSLFVYGIAGVGATEVMATDLGRIYRDTTFGFQVGAGAEFKVLDQLSLRVDYVYTNPTSPSSLGSIKIPDPALGVIQFGITYRF